MAQYKMKPSNTPDQYLRRQRMLEEQKKYYLSLCFFNVFSLFALYSFKLNSTEQHRNNKINSKGNLGWKTVLARKYMYTFCSLFKTGPGVLSRYLRNLFKCEVFGFLF